MDEIFLTRQQVELSIITLVIGLNDYDVYNAG